MAHWIERLPRLTQLAIGIAWVVLLTVFGAASTWYVWYYLPVRELGIPMTFGRYVGLLTVLVLLAAWYDIRRRRRNRSINSVHRTRLTPRR